MTKEECREVVVSVVENIAEAIVEGEEVRLVNFGTFRPSSRKETVKRQTVTGEEIEVPVKMVPVFSPGKGFNEAVEENLKVSKDGFGSGKLEVEKSQR